MSDAYSKTSTTSPSLRTKLSDLQSFFASHKTAMLTTRSPNGELHSRCMAIGDVTPDWKLRFLYDSDSYKEKEFANDEHVNVAIDGMDKNNGWVSFAGKASTTNDPSVVKELWNPAIKAWFSDRGDGVHNGEATDPRISILTISAETIRHFHQVRTSIGTAVDIVASALSGKTATPGEIREIKGCEIAAAWEKGELKEP